MGKLKVAALNGELTGPSGGIKEVEFQSLQSDGTISAVVGAARDHLNVWRPLRFNESILVVFREHHSGHVFDGGMMLKWKNISQPSLHYRRPYLRPPRLTY